MFSIFIISCGKTTQDSSTKSTDSSVENKQTEIEQLKKTGWVQEKGNWYYYDNDGKPKIGWVKDKNKSYYFNSLGVMQIGWIKDKGKDYYCDNLGVMQTGWKESNGKWYYLNSDGSMATNTTVDGYYLAYNGDMQEKSTNNSSGSNSSSSISDGSSTTTNEPVQGNRTVYWVSGGKSYHYDRNCPTLKRSKNIQQGPASSCPKTDPCDVCAK